MSYNYTKSEKVGKWTVRVDPRKGYGYFEHDVHGEGGGLWFSGKELTDADGTYFVPDDVALALRKLGYRVDPDFLADPKYAKNPRRSHGGSKAGRSWDAKVGRRRGHRGGFTTPFRIEKWEERDRLHIALEDANGRTIVEWWDDEAREAIEDGFLKPRDLLGSATEYAEHMGLL